MNTTRIQNRFAKQVVINSDGWTRNPAQQRVIDNILCVPTISNVLLFGGGRSGKTFLLVWAMIIRALKCKSRHVIFRKHFNHVKLSIWHETLPKVLDVCFPGLPVKKNNSDYFMEFQNGSSIWLTGLDQKARTEKILGREFSTAYFNECSELDYNSVQTAVTRLAEKNELRKVRWYDCNPPGKQHWSYVLFFKHQNPIDLQPIPNPEAFAFEMLRPEDNLANIDQNYIETLKTLSFRARMRYWKGMWLEDVPGALWTSDRIEKNRVATMPETRDRVTVGVDPAVSQGEKANLTGIVTIARSKGHLFIGRDSSLNGSPFAWGSRAVEDYYDMEADIMVGEVNQGGDLVQSNVWSIDKDIRFKKVHATRGKAVRAEPVANLCEQGKLHVVGQLTDLENEMTGFVPGETDFSPNRLDAMVWAAWELMEKKVQVRSI